MTAPDVQDRLQRALGTAYTIERELGGGGMSRVFLADEAALGRRVVVKVLRPELAEGISAERFKREVKLAARLQHPHVVPLLATGELDGGALFYTMPFVEGESLRARLDRDGALPVTDVRRILRDAASALAYAHAQGIVHRDIKPENILLSHGGAMVTDFGIAKAISASIESDGAAPSRRSTLTAAGTSIGTPAYMSPEQASGDLVDSRADLYALGVVAYELLAGRPPFEGRNAQQLLAAHATQTPEAIDRRRQAVPPSLAGLVMRLLEKHPADRPQTAESIVAALDTTAEEPAATAQTQMRDVERTRPARRPTVMAIAVAIVAALTGTLAGMVIGRGRATDPSSNPVRPVFASLSAPPDHEIRTDAGFALSPDGSRLAFVAADPRGATAIWIRPLDVLAATRIAGTDGGTNPFWSPDGASLGYFSRGELRIVELRTAAHRSLCPAPRPGGGTWTARGTIVYAPDFLGVPLYKVPAAGGSCAQLTRYRPQDFDHRRPVALPDGRHVLFSSFRANVGLVVDVETGAMREVRAPANEVSFAPPNWLLFRDVLGPLGIAGPVFAQRFDLESLRPTGEAQVVVDRLGGITGVTRYSVSSRVFVAPRPADRAWTLAWVNRQSAVVDSVVAPVEASPFNSGNVSVSGRGNLIAFGGIGLWIHDRERNVATRARAQTMPGQGTMDPSWSPGDSVIAYSTVFRGPLMLRAYRLATDTSDSLFALGRRNVRFPTWSPDGGRIAFQLSAGDTVPRDEIWTYSLAERSATRAFESPANVSTPRWSPDGEWLAYVSDETGAPQVYLRRVDGRGAAVQVSNAGGEVPRWRRDGRELYYRAPDGPIMAVGVSLGSVALLTRPRIVVASPPFSRLVRSIEAAPDGETFMGLSRGEPPVFTIILDWATRGAKE